jgi:hypothetical protein
MVRGCFRNPNISKATPICSWLVVSTPLKNMKVNGKDYPIYYGKMFETTNQPGLTLGFIHLDTLLSLWLSASDPAADSSRAVISKDYVGLWNAKYLFHRIVMISAMEYYDLWNTMTNGIL